MPYYATYRQKHAQSPPDKVMYLHMYSMVGWGVIIHNYNIISIYTCNMDYVMYHPTENAMPDRLTYQEGHEKLGSGCNCVTLQT